MNINTAIYDSLRVIVIVMDMIMVDLMVVVMVMVKVMIMVEVLVIREYKLENICGRGKIYRKSGW